jgi:Flp pilus assembly pilin Flp
MEKLRTTVGSLATAVTRRTPSLRAPLVGVAAEQHETERGQGLAEYALILAFIAIVAIAALAFFGLQVSGVLTNPVGSEIGNVLDIITP